MAVIPGAEPFFLPGGETGILVVHGFTGAPSEMRLLGDYLHNLGYTVLGPRLAGHGVTPEEMARTFWSHWYGSVEDGYHLLAGICKRVMVVGLSMGGLLALKLASEYPVERVAALSTPIYIANKRLKLLPLYRMYTNFVPKERKHLSDEVDEYSISYNVTPLNCLASLLKLISHVDGLLPSITVPALVLQSKKEHTVEPKSAEYIYDKLGSHEKELVWLKKSGHIVTLDIERDFVFKTVGQFLAGNS